MFFSPDLVGKLSTKMMERAMIYVGLKGHLLFLTIKLMLSLGLEIKQPLIAFQDGISYTQNIIYIC